MVFFKLLGTMQIRHNVCIIHNNMFLDSSLAEKYHYDSLKPESMVSVVGHRSLTTNSTDVF